MSFLNRPTQVASRTPASGTNHRVISAPGQLIDLERNMLQVPIRAFNQLCPGYIDTDNLTDEFAGRVFGLVFARGWTTRHRMGACPVISPRTAAQFSIPVGALARDLPPPRSAVPKRRRMNGIPGGTTLNRVLTPSSEHRRRGGPVYLSPILNCGEAHIRWDWKDGENAYINWCCDRFYGHGLFSMLCLLAR
jgi:hypothetical protein